MPIPTGEAFGFEAGTPGLSEGAPDPLEEPEAPSPAKLASPAQGTGEPAAPAPGTEPADPAATAATAPTVPAAGQEPEEPAAPETPAERRWADKYATPEALEEGYLKAHEGMSRAFERARVAEERATQVEAYLRQALPYLEQMAQGAAARPAGGTAPQVPADFDPSDPNQIAALVAQLVEPQVESRVAARVGEMESRYASQFEAQRQASIAEAAVVAFRAEHPDVQMGSPEEYAVADVMRTYGLPFDPKSMNRAYEIMKTPRLSEVVRANPTFAQTEEGMSLARTLASLPAEFSTAQAQAVERARSEQATAAQRALAAAHVETGGTGAPVQAAPGARPKDEFDEAIEDGQKNAARSVFGV